MDRQIFYRLKPLFEARFGSEPEYKFFANGRLEILGNHTDHQKGRCIVAGCSLGIHALVSKADDIFIESVGFGLIHATLSGLEPNPDEYGTSESLVKGVLRGFLDRNYEIGGFHAVIDSTIFPGAGISSSAAYELLIAEILNVLYNDGAVPKTAKAEIGKFAENIFFGKGSGLLDQMGASYGGLLLVDFAENPPLAEPLEFPEEWNLHIVLVDPGMSHLGLSDLYGEMPRDMYDIAALFGKQVLSEVRRPEFDAEMARLGDRVMERKKLRAVHYFDEIDRVNRMVEAIKTKNRAWFLELEREGQLSQTYLLKNAMLPGHYEQSPLQAVDRAREVLRVGASRVMGGGLAGTTINFVPHEEFRLFMETMKRYYGEKHVVEVLIPHEGAHAVHDD